MRTGAVIIAGGTGAIGGAIAHALMAQGMRVIVWGRRSVTDPELGATLGELGSPPPEYRQCDVRQMAEVRRAVAELANVPIRAAIYCAGVSRPGAPLQTRAEDLTDMVAVNLAGAVYFGDAIGAHMESQRSGVILYLSSWAAHVPEPSDLAYGATKAAATSYFRGLAAHLAPYRVRANVLEVGVVGGRGMAARHRAADPDGYSARVAAPIGRDATPEEIADAALYLISPQASYMTGSVVLVDGGASLRPGG
jgi:2,3-dihydro-2,3-dihydroxybenzoate dehydrogenase